VPGLVISTKRLCEADGGHGQNANTRDFACGLFASFVEELTAPAAWPFELLCDGVSFHREVKELHRP
jgi:hypothetical protein